MVIRSGKDKQNGVLIHSESGYTALVEEQPAIVVAAQHLSRGDLVAFPTETVYGLGADARNPLAVRRIFAAKERPVSHPLIVHLAKDADLTAWGAIDHRARTLAEAFWPGPLTLILPRHISVPHEVTGGLETVGLRVPDHPIAQALLSEFGGGIAAPSANRFGRISPTTSQHVRDEFGTRVMVLEGGPSTVGVESTIVDLSSPTAALLRPGAISAEVIAEAIGPLGSSQTPAPGTLEHHYAPQTALRLSNTPEEEAARLEAQGWTVAILPASDPTDHAHRLYAELRKLDATGVDVLVAEPAAEGGLGTAINDRLRRAAHRFPIDEQDQE